MEEKIPNPGTEEAIKMGCTCPVIDNNYGKGYMGMKDTFVYTSNCPVHGDFLKDIKEG